MFIDKIIKLGINDFSKDYLNYKWSFKYKYYSKFLTSSNYYLFEITSYVAPNVSSFYNNALYSIGIFNSANTEIKLILKNCDLNTTELHFDRIFKHEIRYNTVNDILI